MRSATFITSFMLCEISTTPRPLVGQASDEVEHLVGLGDAQGCGRFVEENDSVVPEHGLGDGDRLALAAGEVGHDLPDRLNGAYRQPRECLSGAALHRAFIEGR